MSYCDRIVESTTSFASACGLAGQWRKARPETANINFTTTHTLQPRIFVCWCVPVFVRLMAYVAKQVLKISPCRDNLWQRAFPLEQAVLSCQLLPWPNCRASARLLIFQLA